MSEVALEEATHGSGVKELWGEAAGLREGTWDSPRGP